MIKGLLASVRFLWAASAGHRLLPWRSPYLRWRVETYTGKVAGTLVPADFVRLAWRERGQMLKFFGWVAEMGRISRGEAR